MTDFIHALAIELTMVSEYLLDFLDTCRVSIPLKSCSVGVQDLILVDLLHSSCKRHSRPPMRTVYLHLFSEKEAGRRIGKSGE